jgi:hypothetical protein
LADSQKSKIMNPSSVTPKEYLYRNFSLASTTQRRKMPNMSGGIGKAEKRDAGRKANQRLCMMK